MDKDLFKHLPSEIVFVIFSNLPIRSIGFCKCVCKSWRNLVGTHEFAKLHLSQSTAPCLVYRRGLKNFSIFELNDDLDLAHHEPPYKLFTKFTFPRDAALQGSTNGLLFLRRDQYYGTSDLYICNPITRDYIKLPYEFSLFRGDETATYGFGASKMSGQHKVVGIFHGFKLDDSARVIGASKSECRVYTLETGSWRSIDASSAGTGNPLNYMRGNYVGAVFVKGNLHWLATDNVNGAQLISCFDLETEVFRTFPPPLHGKLHGLLSVLGNCLSFCEKRNGDGKLIIWLAKDEKCWTQEFAINTSINIDRSYSMYPINIFGDGHILIAPSMVYLYSTKTKKSSKKLGIFNLQGSWESVIYTPSFLSLKCFGIQTAITYF